jgi:biopolymer transport protein ExbD
MKLKRPEMRRARIEIIPMIDTIFFLLVFFMITWLSMVKMNGMGLSIPRENKSRKPVGKPFLLSIDPSGGYFVDSTKSTSGKWGDALRLRLAKQPDVVVVLNVAPNLKTQSLIEIMDETNKIIADSHGRAQVLVATPKVETSPAKIKKPN